MTIRGKKSLRNAFFRALGPNAATFKAMFDAAPELCLNMKDLRGRFMALNRRNCEVSGIKDEWDVIGLTSADIFPAPYANAYMALDAEVRRTGRPLLDRIIEFPTDRSRNFMVSNLYPLFGPDGKLIGTAHVYTVTSKRDARGFLFHNMRDAADYIMSHLAARLTIAELAGLAHMSPSSFKKAFAATFDMPPGRYILTAHPHGPHQRRAPAARDLEHARRGHRHRLRLLRPEPFHAGVHPRARRHARRLPPPAPQHPLSGLHANSTRSQARKW